uniref:Uncharacterized protein n=1 Tax=Synura sphagnicola TaxID=52556 RepID=A0A3G2QZ28_9STRA|nr:hypothetical protein [Synura sphagnicola]AYO28313.1 hypothetical protein [Synura sphagnicola]
MINRILFLVKWFQKLVQPIFQNLYDIIFAFRNAYPKTSERIIVIIQLSFIFFFAFVDLCHSILTSVFALGAFPAILVPVWPVLYFILNSSFFQYWASPEKSFFLSYLVLELMISRSLFKLSKFIKYYILLIFSLLMLQGLVLLYWDLLFNREVVASAAKWAFDKGILIHTDVRIGVLVYFGTFLVFVGLYFYLYITALQGKIATLPGLLSWITDSVAFWLKIRVRKPKKEDKKKIQQEEPPEDLLDDE